MAVAIAAGVKPGHRELISFQPVLNLLLGIGDQLIVAIGCCQGSP